MTPQGIRAGRALGVLLALVVGALVAGGAPAENGLYGWEAYATIAEGPDCVGDECDFGRLRELIDALPVPPPPIEVEHPEIQVIR